MNKQRSIMQQDVTKITISLTKLDIAKCSPYKQEAIVHKHSPNQQQRYQWS